MRPNLMNRMNLFIQNRDIIKKGFGWENSYIYPLCASLYAQKNQTADVSRMQYCKQLMKSTTNCFSNFRANSKMAVITMLALADNCDQMWQNMQYIYSKLKEIFWKSEYLVITAVTIAQIAPPTEYDRVISRVRVVYNLMKKRHPMMTHGDDCAMAALLALSEKSDAEIDDRLERCYQNLQGYFFSNNATYSLCQVLVLGDMVPEDGCNRVRTLYETLRNRGLKYGKNYELATLGVLALTNVSPQILTDEMAEADSYLKGVKGFGAFGIGAKQRLMYAGILAMCDHVEDARAQGLAMQGTADQSAVVTTALTSVVSLVIAQQAAMCAAVAASSAAASSSASS